MPKIDMLRASLPLSDSMNATFSLCYADHSQNWRAEFIVAITTLRAVGHVLHKVDCERFPQIAPTVRKRFERWKRGDGDDELFVYFIEDARNVLLKSYRFPGDESIVFKSSSSGEFAPGDPDPNLIGDGHFAGSSIIGLLQHSHTWWIRELSEFAELIN